MGYNLKRVSKKSPSIVCLTSWASFWLLRLLWERFVFHELTQLTSSFLVSILCKANEKHLYKTLINFQFPRGLNRDPYRSDLRWSFLLSQILPSRSRKVFDRKKRFDSHLAFDTCPYSTIKLLILSGETEVSEKKFGLFLVLFQ